MADFSATLRATLAKLGEPSPEMRQKVYAKAREAIERKIDAMPTRPPQAAIDRQYEKLDAAIADVETDYEPSVDELEDDFDDVLLAVDEPAPEPEAEPVAVSENVDAQEPEPEEPEPVVEEPPAKAEDPLKAFLEQQDKVAQEDESLSEPASPLPPRSPEVPIAPVARRDDDISLDAPPKPETPSSGVDDWLKSDTPAFEPGDDADDEGGRRWGLIGALVALVLIFGGLIYAAIAYQDELMAMIGGDTVDGVPVRTVESTPVEANDENAGEGTDDVASATGGEDVEKFTQRLTEDGTEVDEGPVGGEPTQGEGSTVASQSAGTAEPSDPASTGQAAAPLPVGQRALFYEERTGTQAGTSFPGAAIWSVVQEAPAAGLEPEPSIRAEASVPDLGIVMEMIIKRNGDSTLPASHIAELFFRVPDTFEGRGIADIQRITLKETESDPGNALIAVPAPLDTNIFLIALNDAATAVESNLGLLANQEWIDIPMQYVSGRRALITLEKGSAGKAVFDEVLEYWGQNPLTQ